MSDDTRREADSLWMHCKHDSEYLLYLIKDYLRLKEENSNLAEALHVNSQEVRTAFQIINRQKIDAAWNRHEGNKDASDE